MSRKTKDMDAMAAVAIRDALAKVVAENRRRKLPLTLWRNGKVALLLASKVRLTKRKKANYARI